MSVLLYLNNNLHSKNVIRAASADCVILRKTNFVVFTFSLDKNAMLWAITLAPPNANNDELSVVAVVTFAE